MLRRLHFSGPLRRWLLLAGISGALFALWLGVFLRLRPSAPRQAVDAGGPNRGVEFSPDSRFLLCRGPLNVTPHSVRVYNVQSGELIANQGGVSGHHGSVVVAPDGRYVAIQTPSRPWHLFDTATGKEIAALPCSIARSSNTIFFFSADDSFLVYANATPGKNDPTSVVVWGITRRQPIHALGGEHWPICLSPDSKHLATWHPGSEKDKRGVRLWEPLKGREIATLEGLDREPLQLQFSPDGRFLMAAVQMDERAMVGNPPRPYVPYSEILLWSVDPPRVVQRWPLVRFATFVLGEPLISLHYGYEDVTYAVEHWRLPSDSEPPKLVWRKEGLSNYWTGRYNLESRTDAWVPHPARRWAMEAVGGHVPERRETTSIRLTDWQGNAWKIETDGRAYAQLSPDEKTLLVSHSDGRVELYDVPPERPIVMFSLFSGVVSLLFTLALWWRLVR